MPARPTLLRHATPVLALLAALALSPAGAADLKLRLLETTDLHMNLLAWDDDQDRPTTEYGLARTAPLIRSARAEARNSLLFDNGDLLQGSPMGDLVARVKPLPLGVLHPAYKVLNALGMDAAHIGNHKFNYGPPFLRQAIAGANFPSVSANVHIDDGDGNRANDAHALAPWVILERRFTDEAGAPQTLKIGVLGLVPPKILMWDKQHLEVRLTLGDIQETARCQTPAARRLVRQVRVAGADLIILIPHAGLGRGKTPRSAENSVARLAKVPGVGAILFGHAQSEFPGAFVANHPKVDLGRSTINGVPSVMPGLWGHHLEGST